MFGFFKGVDHAKMASLLRTSGPQLFQRLIEEMRSARGEKQNDLFTVIDLSDLFRFKKKATCSQDEKIILDYLIDNIRRVGRFDGLETIACGMHGACVGNYVLTAEDIANYNGSPREPVMPGDKIASAIFGTIFAVFYGTVMVTISTALLIFWKLTVLIPFLLFVAVLIVVWLAKLQTASFYEYTAERNTDRYLAALKQKQSKH